MMTMMSRFAAPLLACLIAAPAVAMQAMEDSDLGDVVGQEGISIKLELRVNADAAGAPLSGAGDDINCNGLTGPCTFSLGFANRPGEWLVFKEYYYALRVDNQYLDASTLSETGSNAAYFDAAESLPGTSGNSRFEDSSGTCLLSGGCTAANIATLQAMRMSVPATATSYDRTGNGSSSGYTSVLLGGSVGGLAVQFGATAYDTPTTASFLGLNIRDNNSNFAGVKLTGNVYLFGF